MLLWLPAQSVSPEQQLHPFWYRTSESSMTKVSRCSVSVEGEKSGGMLNQVSYKPVSILMDQTSRDVLRRWWTIQDIT
jgi:hypothetical protein